MSNTENIFGNISVAFVCVCVCDDVVVRFCTIIENRRQKENQVKTRERKEKQMSETNGLKNLAKYFFFKLNNEVEI